MSQRVIFEVDAKEAKGVAAFLRMEDAERKATLQAKKLGRAGKQAGKDSSRGMKIGATSAMDFAKQLGLVATAAGGVMAVAAQLKAEYENLVQRQREAAQTQISVAEARNRALQNRPSDMSPAEVNELVERGVKSYDLGKGGTAEAWNLMNTMMSARGGAGKAALDKAFLEALHRREALGRGADVTTYGGSILDVMNIRPEASAMQAAGWVDMVRTASRITSAQKAAQSIPLVAGQAEELRFGAEAGAELYAAFTGGMTDRTGERSRTALIQFMRRIHDARTAEGALLPVGKDFGGGWRYGTIQGTGMEGLAELQEFWAGAGEEQRAALIKKMAPEAGAIGTVRALLGRDPQMMKRLEEAQRQITPILSRESAGAAREYYAAVGQGEYEVPRRLQAGVQSETERLRLDSGEAIAGVLREEIQNLLGASGMGDLEQKALAATWEFKSGLGTGGQIQSLRAFQETLRRAEWDQLKLRGLNWAERRLREAGWAVFPGMIEARDLEAVEAARETSYGQTVSQTTDTLVAKVDELISVLQAREARETEEHDEFWGDDPAWQHRKRMRTELSPGLPGFEPSVPEFDAQVVD